MASAVSLPESPPPLRVLFVEANEDGTTGGSHRSLYELTRRLDRNRYHPVVLFYQANRFADMLREGGIEVIDYESVRRRELAARSSGGVVAKVLDIAAAIPRRARLIREEHISFVHINNSPSVAFDDWLLAARLARVPIVSSVRGDDRPGNRLARLLWSRFDLVMPVSRWIADVMRESGIPDSRIRLVYNGVDVQAIRDRVRRGRDDVRVELGVPEGGLLAVMVGNLRPWKGQHVVLQAVSTARRLGADVHLALVGQAAEEEEDRRYEEDLRSYVSREGLTNCVSFLGRRTDVPDLFSAADVAIHASVRPEPFGLVLVEAMATGTPVIASNRGGPVEILTDESGFLFDPDEPDELGRILERIAANRTALEPMRQSAARTAQTFDIAVTAKRMEEVYAELLKRTGASIPAAA